MVLFFHLNCTPEHHIPAQGFVLLFRDAPNKCSPCLDTCYHLSKYCFQARCSCCRDGPARDRNPSTGFAPRNRSMLGQVHGVIASGPAVREIDPRPPVTFSAARDAGQRKKGYVRAGMHTGAHGAHRLWSDTEGVQFRVRPVFTRAQRNVK